MSVHGEFQTDTAGSMSVHTEESALETISKAAREAVMGGGGSTLKVLFWIWNIV